MDSVLKRERESETARLKMVFCTQLHILTFPQISLFKVSWRQHWENELSTAGSVFPQDSLINCVRAMICVRGVRFSTAELWPSAINQHPINPSPFKSSTNSKKGAFPSRRFSINEQKILKVFIASRGDGYILKSFRNPVRRAEVFSSTPPQQVLKRPLPITCSRALIHLWTATLLLNTDVLVQVSLFF